MKKFRASRDDGRFALTTPQNPNLEVRSLCEMIAAVEKLVACPPWRAEGAACPPQQAISDDPSSNDASPRAELLTSPEDGAEDADFAEARPIVTTLVAARTDVPQDNAPARETSLDPDESPESQPRPRRKTLRRKSAGSSRKKPVKNRSLAPRVPRRELTDRERHERKCFICHHPNREEIDEDILHWCNPANITSKYFLRDYRCIYRHAHATGLMERRRLFMRDALEHVVEHAESVAPTADAVIRAVPACGRINARGEWVDPPTQVVYSSDAPRRAASTRSTLECSENLPQLPPAIDVKPVISRQSQILENAVSHSKQTNASSSNRQFFAGVARKIRAFLDA